MIWWGFWALMALVVIAPFVREALLPKRGERERRDAPGAFVRLSRGATHYRWRGPEDGPVVVCVHGLTTPSFVFDPLAEGLAGQGCRVLVYDHYGRGYSDRPRGVQDSEFFVSHLEELLESQTVKGDFTLLGYSMGGAVAAAFAARHPSMIRRLVLLAPAGMGHDLGPVVRLVVNHNWLGRWLMLAFYARSLRRSTEAERGLAGQVDGMVDKQLDETRWRGFAPAVLNSLRGILDGDLEEDHRKIARHGMPVLAIWGAEDDVIPPAGKDKLAEWNPAAHQTVISDAGHTLAYTHDNAVLKAMCEADGD